MGVEFRVKKLSKKAKQFVYRIQNASLLECKGDACSPFYII